MTDFTSGGTAMHHAARARHAPPRLEYRAYFSIIFAFTLPLAVLTWSLTALRHKALPPKGPLARARSQARIITPMIFNG